MGDIYTLEWILQIKPDLKFSTDGAQLFRVACTKGYLDIVEWLMQIKPDIDISANKNKAFFSACQNKHLSIVKWFQKRNPKVYGIEYDEKGVPKCYLRTDETRWKSRKMGLVAMKKENNLLGRLPTDVAKMSLEYV